MKPKALFINGSPHEEGKTAAIAEELLNGLRFETLALTDYRINFYGQELPGDQFDEILAKMKEADITVLGSQVYWHNMSGALRTLLDRFYGPVPTKSMHGDLYFVFQGFAPEQWMIDDAVYTIKTFCDLYGYTYKGLAQSWADAHAFNKDID